MTLETLPRDALTRPAPPRQPGGPSGASGFWGFTSCAWAPTPDPSPRLKTPCSVSCTHVKEVGSFLPCWGILGWCRAPLQSGCWGWKHRTHLGGFGLWSCFGPCLAQVGGQAPKACLYLAQKAGGPEIALGHRFCCSSKNTCANLRQDVHTGGSRRKRMEPEPQPRLPALDCPHHGGGGRGTTAL